VVATTVVTKSNTHVLAEIGGWLLARGVTGWALALPRARGRAALAFDRVVPRIGLAVPFALHAIAAARRAGLAAWIRGAPICALGELSDRALPSGARAFAPACARCAARAGCPGVSAAYLRRHGDGELAPLARPPAADPAPPAAAGWFVGTGLLGAEVDLARLPSPPAARRAQIPELGRARPAADERRPARGRREGG
jgi:hypothetical protein